jgi:hypothetical protein
MPRDKSPLLGRTMAKETEPRLIAPIHYHQQEDIVAERPLHIPRGRPSFYCAGFGSSAGLK